MLLSLRLVRFQQTPLYLLCVFAGVHNVLAKQNHNVFNRSLQVTVYHECLGQIPLGHDTTTPVPKAIPEAVPANGLIARTFGWLWSS